MRGRGHSGSSSDVAEDKSQHFMMTRLLQYLDRLLASNSKLDYATVEIVHWLVGSEIIEEDLLPLAVMLGARGRRRPFEEEIEEEIHNSRDFAHLMDQALRRIRGDEQLVVIDLFKGLLKKRLAELHYSGTSDIEKNLNLFQQMFGLSDLEKELCLFFLIMFIYEEAQSLFEHNLKCDHYAGRGYLATILDTTPSDISKSINGKLSQIGILESGRGGVCLERDFLRFLQSATEANINTEFFKKIEPEALSLDMHDVEPEIVRHALHLLSPQSDKGSVLLLYGNPGVGKTTFAYGLAKELGLDIYLCKHEGKDKQWQRQAAIMASVNMALRNKNSLLIIDDCDSILGTRHLWSLFGAYNDKKWLHEVLESEAKIIFIVNDVRFLEESVIRRFSFSIHFKPFNRNQRIRLWKNLIQKHQIEDFFTDAQISELATVYDTSPGVIDLAVKKSVLASPTHEEGFYKAITLSLDAHERLCGGGRKPVRTNLVDKNFTLEGLNVSGNDLSGLLEELKAFGQYLKEGGNDGITTMSLLFHGPSGTGKSHMARHVAHVLDKELVIKRGSDLLSPYVGETEANIRSAYEEAESKGVLVIDEADSLIFNRDRAERSWELSFTNEFLNCMENFRGIQIFTTNRLTDLDSASLRRLNYKLQFDYLEPEGKVVFYKKLLAPLVPTDLDTDLEGEIEAIPALAPGDFKVVKSKFLFRSQDNTSHRPLIVALKEESKTKEVHAGTKAIGFWPFQDWRGVKELNKHFRNYFRRQRELKGISLGPLAEMIGYRNRNKGARLILNFEREGIISGDLLKKLIDALEVDPQGMIQAMEKDKAEWEQWVNEPVPMQMIIRPIPAVNLLHPMPPEIKTTEEAEKYAQSYAKEKGFRVCLVVSRRESLWIGGDGEITCRTFAKPGVPNIPYATLGGRRKFLFGTAERGFHPIVIRESQ
ncbi:MAG: AAA family ATPase [Desulfomonilaceae bacterium]